MVISNNEDQYVGQIHTLGIIGKVGIYTDSAPGYQIEVTFTTVYCLNPLITTIPISDSSYDISLGAKSVIGSPGWLVDDDTCSGFIFKLYDVNTLSNSVDTDVFELSSSNEISINTADALKVKTYNLYIVGTVGTTIKTSETVYFTVVVTNYCPNEVITTSTKI